MEWSEEEYFVRNRQVRERCFEACQTLTWALTLNRGEAVTNLLVKDFEGHDQVFFAGFKESMDVNNPIMCGHSFGGATTLMALGTLGPNYQKIPLKKFHFRS